MNIVYARVSTANQNLDAQIDALTAAGAEHLFSYRASSAKAECPEMDKMLDRRCDGGLQTGDARDRLLRDGSRL